MTNQIDITVSLKDTATGTIRVAMACRMADQPAAPETRFVLEVLRIGNGITVTDLAAHGPNGAPVPVAVDGSTLRIRARAFTLSYTVQTSYSACVGVDCQREFVYPFANPREVLFGSGILAYPAALDDDLRVTVQVIDLPPRFGLFSNMLAPDNVIPAQVKSFFVYCAANLDPIERVYTSGEGHDLALRLLVQRGKQFPMEPEVLLAFGVNVLRTLEQRITPYDKTDAIHILVLQADPGFEQLAGGRTFATGENVINGIVCYAPPDGDYLERTLGYREYDEFLYDSIAHELTHLYTTSSDDGRYKAILYPSVSCPRQDRHLIGEALAGYLHLQTRNMSMAHMAVANWIARQTRTGRRSAHLDLLRFEVWLKMTHGVSLWDVMRVMAERKRAENTPFESADILFDALESLGIETPPEQWAWLVGPDVPDYAAVMKSVFPMWAMRRTLNRDKGGYM